MEKIRVYSLSQSAIDFMYKSLLTNFVDFDFQPQQVQIDVTTRKIIPYEPTLKESEYAIIIQSDIDDDTSEGEYNYFYNTPQREKWNPKRYIIVSSNEMKSFHGYLLLMMQIKFGLQVKENWETPTQIK
jgi:hypothetical protein